mgnify:FL=1|jgi:hypothetical protein|tara:strand:+ start:283 stop:2196 length:1914 start_codon:yes stop_codon:yes gene_type:complete
MAPARNEPCPCGSAKKYKKCCAGKETAEKARASRLDEHELDELPPPWRELSEREELQLEDAMETALRFGLDCVGDRSVDRGVETFNKNPAKCNAKFRKAYHSQLTNPNTWGATSYWCTDVELSRVHLRFMLSFSLRCGDEANNTVRGELIGPRAAGARGENFVPGDTLSKDTPLMREFNKYLERAREKNVLPECWGDIDDHAVTTMAASENGVAFPVDKSVIEKMYGPNSGEVEILRQIALDVLGVGHSESILFSRQDREFNAGLKQAMGVFKKGEIAESFRRSCGVTEGEVDRVKMMERIKSTMESPMPGATAYWCKGVERMNVITRFVLSFSLRCGDEALTDRGELIGPYAAVARGDEFVNGNTNSRVMCEFKAYLELAKKKNALPDCWSDIDDQGVLYSAAGPQGVATPIDETDVTEMCGPLAFPGEVEILRQLAEDVLGDRVDAVEGGSWVSVAGDTDESESDDDDDGDDDGDSDGHDSLDAILVKECSLCGAEKYTDGKSCKKCKCGLVRYCSKACQTNDWGNHKARCKKAREDSKHTRSYGAKTGWIAKPEHFDCIKNSLGVCLLRNILLAIDRNAVAFCFSASAARLFFCPNNFELSQIQNVSAQDPPPHAHTRARASLPPSSPPRSPVT